MNDSLPIPNGRARIKEVRKILDVDEQDRSVILGPGILTDGSTVYRIGSDGSYRVPALLLGNQVSPKVTEQIENYIKNVDYFVGGELL